MRPCAPIMRKEPVVQMRFYLALEKRRFFPCCRNVSVGPPSRRLTIENWILFPILFSTSNITWRTSLSLLRWDALSNAPIVLPIVFNPA